MKAAAAKANQLTGVTTTTGRAKGKAQGGPPTSLVSVGEPPRSVRVGHARVTATVADDEASRHQHQKFELRLTNVIRNSKKIYAPPRPSRPARLTDPLYPFAPPHPFLRSARGANRHGPEPQTEALTRETDRDGPRRPANGALGATQAATARVCRWAPTLRLTRWRALSTVLVSQARRSPTCS